MPINFKLVTNEDGTRSVAVFSPLTLDTVQADEAHPNFEAIVEACHDSLDGVDVDLSEVVDLFNVPATIERKFQRLGERVTVEGSQVMFDGDPVDGVLQDQILDFLDSGDDFGALVNFYEKLATNPLGDVREGLFTWIKGQRKYGNFTITPSGDLLGYKAVSRRTPEWRTDVEGDVFVPSRASRHTGDRVNGVEVQAGQFIEQVEGDVVEMPRSVVLNEPSRECGTGLHIGTYAYAESFTGDTVMLVQFSPRDIVSLPDSNSSWKLRVSRYTVVEAVTEPLQVPLYLGADVEPDWTNFEFVNLTDEEADDLDVTLQIGDRVTDSEGIEGTVTATADEDGDVLVDFDDEGEDYAPATALRRIHGKGGPTSYAAKGSGRNPHQDTLGRFSSGRPGSTRDSSTGRFA